VPDGLGGVGIAAGSGSGPDRTRGTAVKLPLLCRRDNRKVEYEPDSGACARGRG